MLYVVQRDKFMWLQQKAAVESNVRDTELGV